MKILYLDFYHVERGYMELLKKLPPKYRALAPYFDTFISPTRSLHLRWMPHDQTFELSEDEYARYQMLLSPHALALVTAVIINGVV